MKEIVVAEFKEEFAEQQRKAESLCRKAAYDLMAEIKSRIGVMLTESFYPTACTVKIAPIGGPLSLNGPFEVLLALSGFDTLTGEATEHCCLVQQIYRPVRQRLIAELKQNGFVEAAFPDVLGTTFELK